MLLKKLLLIITLVFFLIDTSAMARGRKRGRGGRGGRRINANAVLGQNPFRNRAFNRFNPFFNPFAFNNGNFIRGFDPRAPFFGVDRDGSISSDNRLIACSRIAESSGFDRGRLLQQSHAAGIDCSEFAAGRRPVAAGSATARPASTPPSPNFNSAVAAGGQPGLPAFVPPALQPNFSRALRPGEPAVCADPYGQICKRDRQSEVQAKLQSQAQTKLSLTNSALSAAGLTAQQLGDSSNEAVWVENYKKYLTALLPMLEQKDPVNKGREIRSAMGRAVDREAAKIKFMDPRDPVRLQFEAQQGDLKNRATTGEPVRSYGQNILALLNSNKPLQNKISALVSATNTCGTGFTELNAVNASGDIYLCSAYLNNTLATDEQLTRVIAHECGHNHDHRTQRYFGRYGQCNNLPEHELNEAVADFWANKVLAERMDSQDPLTVAQNAFGHFCNPSRSDTIPTSALARAALNRKRASGPDEHSEHPVRIKDLFANDDDIAAKFGCQGGTGKNLACSIAGQKSVGSLGSAVATRADTGLPTGIAAGI